MTGKKIFENLLEQSVDCWCSPHATRIIFGAARLVPVDRRSRPLSLWVNRKGYVAAIKKPVRVFRKVSETS